MIDWSVQSTHMFIRVPFQVLSKTFRAFVQSILHHSYLASTNNTGGSHSESKTYELVTKIFRCSYIMGIYMTSSIQSKHQFLIKHHNSRILSTFLQCIRICHSNEQHKPGLAGKQKMGNK
jgi:hypothetical protein